jgi:hypothetical protein
MNSATTMIAITISTSLSIFHLVTGSPVKRARQMPNGRAPQAELDTSS